MACKNHEKPLEYCIPCYKDIIEQQGKMLEAYANRLDTIWMDLSVHRDVIYGVEQEFPLTVRK